MAKVTGLGGVFYKVEQPEKTRLWYREILGIGGDSGAHFPWKTDTSGEAYSLVSPFKASTEYLSPSKAAFMINLRVDDLDDFVEMLKGKGVEILDAVEGEYGKFAWIIDCDGIKIELWQQAGPAPE